MRPVGCWNMLGVARRHWSSLPLSSPTSTRHTLTDGLFFLSLPQLPPFSLARPTLTSNRSSSWCRLAPLLRLLGEVRIISDEWTDERRRPARLLLTVELMRALSGSWETLNPLLGPFGSTITLPWLERGVNETCLDGLLISNTAARSED